MDSSAATTLQKSVPAQMAINARRMGGRDPSPSSRLRMAAATPPSHQLLHDLFERFARRARLLLGQRKERAVDEIEKADEALFFRAQVNEAGQHVALLGGAVQPLECLHGIARVVVLFE